MKIYSVLALALGLVAIPAVAQTAAPAPAAATAPAIKVGVLVWSAEGHRVGRIDSVRGDVVAVINDMRMVYIPVSTLSTGARGLVSSLSLKDLDRL